MEIAKAYVQIIPSTQGVKEKLESELGDSGKSGGESFGKSFTGKLKGLIAAAGIGAAVKSAMDAGGALQQSFGGLDTIYEDASEAAKEYAREAARAGISMNDYAEQAVSFGASLKQAFKGDTMSAMEAANTAILDMTDNAAKMGTPLESIQNAYQGFAKQNYTMLDNLKLGYGGTKTEMERLLADAQKLSGVEYDIENLGDVYEAIHVIQQDLGLTGVAAAEASETFTGSMGAMKASLSNFMADLATGGDYQQSLNTLIESTGGFLLNNALPMIGTIFNAIADMLGGDAIPQIIDKIMVFFSENGGKILESGTKLLGNLLTGLLKALPSLIASLPKIIKAIIDAFKQVDWKSVGKDIINGIIQGLKEAASMLWEAAKDLASSALSSIKGALGIHSPSKVFRDEVGKFIPEGVAVGIRTNMSEVTDAMDTLSDQALGIKNFDSLRMDNYALQNKSNDQVYDLLSKYLPNMNTNVNVTLEGDANGLFRAIRKQNRIYTKQTGQSAFA